MGSSLLHRASICLLFFFVVASLPSLAPAQAPAPGPDCITVLLPLLPCLPYVEGNTTSPAKNCCDALPPVISSNPICLCTLLGNNSLGITVNLTDAANLPAACKVQAPPLSSCAAAGYPVPANLTGPVAPPVLPPSPPPTTTPTPSPIASPSTPPSTSPASTVSPAPASALTPTSSPPAPLASSPSPSGSVPTSGPPSPTTAPTSESPSATSPPGPPGLATTPSPTTNGGAFLSASSAFGVVALLVASLWMLQV